MLQDFIIVAEIKVSEYMRDKDTVQKGKLFIVNSDSKENAVKKLRKHLEEKSDTYGTTYYLSDYDFAEKI